MALDWGLVPDARFGHTATVLGGDSHVVVFGGATGGNGNYVVMCDTHMLELASNEWARLYPEGDTPPPRLGHASACMGQKHAQLVVFGGSFGNGDLAPNDLYLLDMDDPEHAFWAKVHTEGPSPPARYGHSLAFGKLALILFGGSNGDQEFNDVWVLDIRDRPFGPWGWTEVVAKRGRAPIPRVYHSCAVCPEGPAAGMVLIFGGRNTQRGCLNDFWGLVRHKDGRWDWERAPVDEGDMPVPRFQHASTFVGDKLFVVGGCSSSNELASESADLQLPACAYDMQRQSCCSIDLGVSRCWHACWAIGRTITLMGGFSADSFSTSVSELQAIHVDGYASAENMDPEEDGSRPDVFGG